MSDTAAGDRVALVTGAGSGLGRAAAIALARDGFRVVLVGRTKVTLAETAVLEDGLCDRMHVIPCDVAKPDSVNALFSKIQDEFGRLDLLFNNAGVNMPTTPIEEIAFEDWQNLINVNLTGMFLCIQGAVRLMKSQTPTGGRIVNNGSIAAYVPRPGSAAYTATKHAVTGLTRSTSLDCRKHNIACGQIDIGNAETQMVAGAKTGVPQADGSIRVEPTINPQDVAAAVVYMANLPLDTNVPFMTVMANEMAYIGRG